MNLLNWEFIEQFLFTIFIQSIISIFIVGFVEIWPRRNRRRKITNIIGKNYELLLKIVVREMKAVEDIALIQMQIEHQSKFHYNFVDANIGYLQPTEFEKEQSCQARLDIILSTFEIKSTILKMNGEGTTMFVVIKDGIEITDKQIIEDTKRIKIMKEMFSKRISYWKNTGLKV